MLEKKIRVMGGNDPNTQKTAKLLALFFFLSSLFSPVLRENGRAPHDSL